MPAPPHAGSNPDAWAPLARALADHAAGARDATIEIESDDGVVQVVPVAVFAGEADEMPDVEAHALDVCRGRVLDVGAGSGRHARALEEAGAEVTAIDVSPELVALMRERGVRDARVADVFALAGERFDTLLLLMNGIGVTGTLAGLDRFLAHARHLLSPGGQVLFDSFDLRASPDPRTGVAIARRESEGRYGGEVTFRLRYGGLEGPPYPWLFVDADTLAARAQAAGWHAQILYEDADGTYLARLLDVRHAAR